MLRGTFLNDECRYLRRSALMTMLVNVGEQEVSEWRVGKARAVVLTWMRQQVFEASKGTTPAA